MGEATRPAGLTASRQWLITIQRRQRRAGRARERGRQGSGRRKRKGGTSRWDAHQGWPRERQGRGEGGKVRTQGTGHSVDNPRDGARRTCARHSPLERRHAFTTRQPLYCPWRPRSQWSTRSNGAACHRTSASEAHPGSPYRPTVARARWRKRLTTKGEGEGGCLRHIARAGDRAAPSAHPTADTPRTCRVAANPTPQRPYILPSRLPPRSPPTHPLTHTPSYLRSRRDPTTTPGRGRPTTTAPANRSPEAHCWPAEGQRRHVQDSIRGRGRVETRMLVLATSAQRGRHGGRHGQADVTYQQGETVPLDEGIGGLQRRNDEIKSNGGRCRRRWLPVLPEQPQLREVMPGTHKAERFPGAHRRTAGRGSRCSLNSKPRPGLGSSVGVDVSNCVL